MNKTFRILGFLSMLLFPLFTTAKNPMRKELAFRGGERLNYVISYSLGFLYTDVGEVKLELKEQPGDKNKYFVRGLGRTYGFYDRIMRVRDKYEAEFLLPDFMSLYFHRDIHEGGYEVKNTYLFNWEQRRIEAKVEQGDSTRNLLIPMTRNQDFDVMTSFYYFRNIDLSGAEPNRIFPFSVALDDGMYNLGCRYAGKERRFVKALDGKLDCLKLELQVIAGEVFRGHEVITIWVSDDANRIPVEMEFPIRIGKMRVRLLKSENLVAPLQILTK